MIEAGAWRYPCVIKDMPSVPIRPIATKSPASTGVGACQSQGISKDVAATATRLGQNIIADVVMWRVSFRPISMEMA